MRRLISAFVLLALFAPLVPLGAEDGPVVQVVDQPITPTHILAAVKMKNGGTRCSGTVVGRGKEYAAILSAAHCVKGNIGGLATFENPDGTEFQAELLAFDRDKDICLFRAPADGPIGCSYVPRDFPQQVQRWEAAGYTAGGGIKYKIVQPQRTNIVGIDAIYRVVQGAFAGGDSGGSVFADGGLVAVISARENGPASNKFNKQIHPGCDHAGIVSFLEQHASQLTDCPPWGCPIPRGRNNGGNGGNWNPGPNIPINPPPRDEDYAPPPPREDEEPPPPPLKLDELIARIDELEEKLAALEAKPGPAGPAGPPGTVTVEINNDGQPINTHRDLIDGSTVLVNVKRFTEPIAK